MRINQLMHKRLMSGGQAVHEHKREFQDQCPKWKGERDLLRASVDS